MPINVEHRIPAAVLLGAAVQSGRAMGEAERVKEGRAARERQLEMLMKREESQQQRAMEGARLQAGMIEAAGRQQISQRQLELQSGKLLQNQQFKAAQLENEHFAEIDRGIQEGTLEYSPATQMSLAELDQRENELMTNVNLSPADKAAGLDRLAQNRRTYRKMVIPVKNKPVKITLDDGREIGLNTQYMENGTKYWFGPDARGQPLLREVTPYKDTPEGQQAAQGAAERVVQLRGQSAIQTAQVGVDARSQQRSEAGFGKAEDLRIKVEVEDPYTAAMKDYDAQVTRNRTLDDAKIAAWEKEVAGQVKEKYTAKYAAEDPSKISSEEIAVRRAMLKATVEGSMPPRPGPTPLPPKPIPPTLEQLTPRPWPGPGGTAETQPAPDLPIGKPYLDPVTGETVMRNAAGQIIVLVNGQWEPR